MLTRFGKPARWIRLAGTGIGLYLFQSGCAIDPDIILRAGISASSDLAIFLLENLSTSI